MKQFTGFEYLLIDVANQFGHDKLLFEERIEWAKSVLPVLEDYEALAENKPLYTKAVMAVRKAQQKVPTGHLVGFDATCSGIQVMSALTGCKAGAEATGLVNPNKRADAYSECTRLMNDILGGVGVSVTRKEAKVALMTSFYGSKAQPVALFGEGTPELKAFYEAATQLAPGAWELLQDLLGSWKPFALKHEWQLPDGYEAKVKVMVPKETRIDVKELDNSSFTTQYKVNEGTAKGLANAANVTHSVDAYVLRCIHRRCNYDAEMVQNAHNLMSVVSTSRAIGGGSPRVQPITDANIAYYVELWERSGMADVVILPYINVQTVQMLPEAMLKGLLNITYSMIGHKPFEVVTVHDEFKCHPNNMNHLRKHYINVFAEMAESTILSMIFSTIYGKSVTYNKLSNDLGNLIRKSNYALC
jgi:hypothetical protein